MAQRFQWGTSDCGFVFDIVRDMTGSDPFSIIRGYNDEVSALRHVRKAGFKTVLEFVEASFEEIDPAKAGRGDLGYPATIPHALMSPAIIDGANAFSKHPAGGVVVPRTLLARAFRV